MEKTYDRLRAARKRSSYEQPPTDSISSDFEPPRLQRRATLQSFLDTLPGVDPYPARFLDEPEELFPDHDTSLRQLDLLAQEYEHCFLVPLRASILT